MAANVAAKLCISIYPLHVCSSLKDFALWNQYNREVRNRFKGLCTGEEDAIERYEKLIKGSFAIFLPK